MIDKNILDNISGQEIKEMINKNKIALEQLDASTLWKLMDYETDMLCIGEGDMDLIYKCSDLLDKIEPSPITSEEFMNIIERSKKEHIEIVDEGTRHNNAPKMRFILKRTALIAAVLLILMTSTVAIAGALGFDICKYILEIVREPDGTEDNIGEFTFYHNGEAKKYASIEDMIDHENLDIMYPSKLPDGIYINGVRISNGSNGNNTIHFITNYPNVGINIELNSNDFNTLNTHSKEFNGVHFYFPEEKVIFAFCYVNGNKYYISADTEENLMLIIENMKE